MKTDNTHIVLRCDDPDAAWIVLVHGVSQDHRIFDRQIEHFSGSYNLMLIDLPGHGRASRISGPYGLLEFADHIDQCLLNEHISKAVFWGTHLGASAGLILACRQNTLFHALVLEGPVFPGRPMASVSKTLSKVHTTAHTEGINSAREVWWTGPWFDMIRKSPSEHRAVEHFEIIRSFEGQPWLDEQLTARPVPTIEEQLAAFSRPVLIMNGELDVQDFLITADELEAALPNVKRAQITGAGGFPLWEKPAAVNRVVDGFIKSALEQPAAETLP